MTTSARPIHFTTLHYLAIIAMTSVAIGLPYWVEGWQLPKTEDFEYTMLPTMLFIRQLAEGAAPWWNPDIALGSPWPIPTGMTHSPFSLLFLWLPPMSVVGAIVAAHALLMGLCGLALFRRFGLTGGVLATALLTLQFSTALEYLYWSDAIAVYVTWTFVPPLFLAADVILRSPLRSALLAALGMGGIVGYLCLNGHIGVLSIYLVGLAAFVIADPGRLTRRLPYFLLAVTVAVGMGAEKLAFLLSEMQRFDANALREQQGLHGGIWGLVYNGLLRPLFLPDWRYVLEPAGWLSGFVAANNFSRTLGFGVVFTVLSFAAIVRPSLIRPFGGVYRSVAVTFITAVLLLLWPTVWLPVIISATWPLRDIAMLMGLILAGQAFTALVSPIQNRLGPQAPSRLLVLQLLVTLGSALALIAGPNWLITRGKETTGFYNGIASAANDTPYSKTLIAALGQDGTPGGRFVVTGEVERMMDIETLVDVGAINNIGLVHGLAEVSFIAKGVSYDTIRPSQLVPYGTIAGDRMQAWRLEPERDQDWTRDDQALLSFLGIEAVVAADGEPVGAPDLEKVGEFASVDGAAASVFVNKAVLPRAFQLPPDLLDQPLGKRPTCSDATGLYCLDLAPIVRDADSKGISYRATGDQFEIAVTSESEDAGRSIVVTQMFRPEWQLDADAIASGAQLGLWNGVMRLDLPPGVESVTAYYRPANLIIARNVTLATTALWVAAILAIGSSWLRLRMPVLLRRS